MTSETHDYSYELRIPKERIAVLIGKKGELKKSLEEQTQTKITIDSNEGIVDITGNNPIFLFSLREIIRAIGRGFNPDIALLLLKQDYVLDIIPLKEFIKTKKSLERLKGRVIGEEGKSRMTIERLTETNISVYGKTISIIGEYEGVYLARRAIEQLLQGSTHSNVYKWLEKRQTDLRKKDLIE
ncbi:RNA-processing protein [Candidatus Woesearchaeota archaeon CG10_big_fil_rev_8_21_14_0_10_30_7]|nr:MAG: RNA-processing protein [Candidatus Woesearchaeota archaeon CG10_big_fil_rev_8_21_14_0_10_30_7]